MAIFLMFTIEYFQHKNVKADSPEQINFHDDTVINPMVINYGVEWYITSLWKEKAPEAYRVIKCESAWRTRVISQTNDVGLFQINMAAHGDNIPRDTRWEKVVWLQDPYNNIDFAYKLYKRNGWRDWFMSRHCHGL